MCTRSICSLLAVVCVAFPAFAGPPGDYGDAPVGNTSNPAFAYPGVVGRFTSRHQHTNHVTAPVQHLSGTWVNLSNRVWLGDIPPTSKNDTTQDPSAPENDCTPFVLVENLGPNPLAEVHLWATASALNRNETCYISIFVDQNRDGQYKDSYYLTTPLAAWEQEWVVRDAPVNITPGTTAHIAFSNIRLFDPTADVWIRAMISTQRMGTILGAGLNWDGTCPAVHGFEGEIEDFRLSFQNAAPANSRTPGVWLNWVYNGTAPPPAPKPFCAVWWKGPFGPIQVSTNCAIPSVFKLNFGRHNSRGGCNTNPDALVGVYGYNHLEGNGRDDVGAVQGPWSPRIAVQAPAPAGVVITPPPMACTIGPALTLPPTSSGFPLRASVRAPSGLLTDPRAFGAQLNFTFCFLNPPRRYRAYDTFVEVRSCGSEVINIAIKPGPFDINYPRAVDALIAPGTPLSLALWTGDLLEKFIDLDPPGRPFPDDDFTNYQGILHHPPFSFAGLDSQQAFSLPESFRLIDASYYVEPRMPTPTTAVPTAVEFMKFNEVDHVTLTATDGTTLDFTLPISPGVWMPISIPLSFGFELLSIQIYGGDGWIDDVHITLDDVPEPDDCIGDFNFDGGIDSNDIIDFFHDWDVGIPTADIDEDGSTDSNDIILFFGYWDSGC